MAISRLSALLALVLLVAGTPGCAAKKVYRDGTPTISGRTGEVVIVELASNPTTGYSWMLTGQPDPTVATLTETDYQLSPSSPLGLGGGHQRWSFKLVAPGTSTMVFSYGRTWENAPAQKATMFNVIVR